MILLLIFGIAIYIIFQASQLMGWLVIAFFTLSTVGYYFVVGPDSPLEAARKGQAREQKRRADATSFRRFKQMKARAKTNLMHKLSGRRR